MITKTSSSSHSPKKTRRTLELVLVSHCQIPLLSKGLSYGSEDEIVAPISGGRGAIGVRDEVCERMGINLASQVNGTPG